MNRSDLCRFSFIVAVVTIPLHNNLNSWAIAFFCGMAIIQSIGKKFRTTPLATVSAAYFCWLALTWFWDSSGGFSIKNLEGYASFLFLPFVIYLAPKFSDRLVYLVCVTFAVTVTVIPIICLIKSWIEYEQSGDSRLFFYHYLSLQMGLNAIFLSNYALQSIMWLLYFRFVHRPKFRVLPETLIIVWVCFLSCIIFLLSSKLIIFLLVITLTFFTVYIGKRRRRLWVSIAIIGGLVLATVVAVNNLYYLRWRLSVTELKWHQGADDNQNGLAARLVMWKSSAELIAERPILGYGINGSHKELMEKYEEKKFAIGLERRYNSHNQYLQTTLMGGVVGFGLFLSLLLLVALRALQTRSILLLLILLHFMCMSMVESTLEVQQELVFFILFIFFFYFHFPSYHSGVGKHETHTKYNS